MTRAGFALALCLAVPRLARAQSDELRQAKSFFEYGNFRQAAKIADDLLLGERPLEEAIEIEACRIAALSHFGLGEGDTARARFYRLLTKDPDFALEAILVAPGALQLFEQVKKDKEPVLAPIRERRRELKRQQEADIERRRREIEFAREAALAPKLERRVEVRTFWWNLIPLGLGQFQQDRYLTGAAFASFQVAGVAMSWVAHRRLDDLHERFLSRVRTEYPGMPVERDGVLREDVDAQRAWVAANYVSVTIALLAYGLGVLEAVARFEPEIVTIIPLQPAEPPAAPAAPAPTAPPPPSPAPGSTPRLTFSPVPGGAAITLDIRF